MKKTRRKCEISSQISRHYRDLRLVISMLESWKWILKKGLRSWRTWYQEEIISLGPHFYTLRLTNDSVTKAGRVISAISKTYLRLLSSPLRCWMARLYQNQRPVWNPFIVLTSQCWQIDWERSRVLWSIQSKRISCVWQLGRRMGRSLVKTG